MARISHTAHANARRRDYGLTLADVSDIISDYDSFESDLGRSGQVRVGKKVGGKQYFLVYRALGDSLLVVTIESEVRE